ncbi:MAG TPA: MFS transporter, partial [Ktedonobacterales bacterium]
MSRVAETSEGVGSAALAGIRKLGGGMLGYPRNVYLLLFFTLGKGFQLSITQVTLSLYAYSIGFKQDFVGLLVAVPSLGSLIAAIPIGYLADRVSRKPLLIITGILNPLAIAVIALSTNATVMIAASVINGMLASAYWVSIIPMLTESVDAKRRVSVMSLNTFLMLGIGSLGGGIGGVVPEWVSSITGLAAASPVPLRFGVLTAALITFIPTIPLFWLIERRKSAGASATASSMETVEAAAAQQVEAETHEADAIRPSARPIALLFLLLLIPDVLYTAG